MRLAAIAALLAVANGTAGPAAAARSDWTDGDGPGFGGPAARGGSMTEAERQRAIVLGIIQRNGSPAGRPGGCICAGGNQAERAGF